MRAVFGEIMVAAEESEPQHSMDSDVEGIELREQEALRYFPAKFLHHLLYTAVLRE